MRLSEIPFSANMIESMNMAINGIISSIFFHAIEFVYSAQTAVNVHTLPHAEYARITPYPEMFLSCFPFVCVALRMVS